MVTLAQRSFAGGELAPALRARVDQAKYAQGASILRNFEVMKSGGARNRAGLRFVSECKEPARTVALRPFIFNTDQTYVLEFGHLYLRFYKSGSPVRLTSQAVTGVTNASPAVVTYGGADTYANGDHVYISGVVGAMAPYINGRTFEVANVNAGANTFELTYIQGGNVDSTSWGAYGSGGTVAEVYEITTPYDETDLQELQVAQSADVVIITHPDYATRKLSRASDTSWTLSAAYFEPAMSDLPGTRGKVQQNASVAGGAGANTYQYTVTAIHATTGDETLMARGDVETVSAVNAAGDYLTMSAATNFITGEYVYVYSNVEADVPELNYREFVVRNTGGGGGTQIALYNIYGGLVDITSTTFSGTLTVEHMGRRLLTAAAPTSGAPHQIIYQVLVPASEYRIYKWDSTALAFGLIGTQGNVFGGATTQTFLDTGITPDLTVQPPFKRDPFFGTGNYPSVCGYYQQRLLLGATDNNPETLYTSMTNWYLNFGVTVPSVDTDAVTFSLIGKEVNRIRHVVDLGTSLVILTQGGEWAVRGDSSGALLPSAVNAKQYGYNGATTLRPITVGNTLLYVQARGNIVRDLGWNFEADGYSTNDLTIFSTHLFEGYTVRDWAYSQSPNQIVWAVRSDGTVLSLTYVREHGILAWARHDTDGDVEQVVVVPEGSEDVPYFVVKRVINGVTYRYVERMASRYVDPDAVEDMIFMDAAKTYDGWHTGATTMTLTSGGGWTYQDTLTLTASAGTFASTDVGKEVHLVGTDGTLIRFSIDAFSSTTVVTGRPHETVPAGMRSVAISTWGLAINTVTGLWHLEGEGVSVLGDGVVLASYNNPSHGTVTVTNGQASISDHAVVIHVGLPYLSDLQTLDIDIAQGETIADKKKLITTVNLHVEKTRGLWAGTADPGDEDATGATALLKLTEFKLRDEEGYDEPPDLTTGVVGVNIAGNLNSNGRVFVRQIDPVPCTVLAAMPSGLVPITGG